MAHLRVIKSADEGKQFDLTEPVVTIGRDGCNKICLRDTLVSRCQAEFRQGAGGFSLVDHGSRNGTLVNGCKITEVVLKPGDQILIGQTTLVFLAGSENEGPPNDLANMISAIMRAGQRAERRTKPRQSATSQKPATHG
ncbi:MAG: FHA domain-containing protein [Gemmataceae bacterium]|nr:FHA domain-containing protein [Gemmataceae bacterium]